jgi:hypothetical protein
MKMNENKKKTAPEGVSEFKEGSEPGKSSISFEELSRIDRIFRERHQDILNDVATVLERYEIKDYRVTGVTFNPPNPSLCLPSVQYVPGVGVRLVVSCLD